MRQRGENRRGEKRWRESDVFFLALIYSNHRRKNNSLKEPKDGFDIMSAPLLGKTELSSWSVSVYEVYVSWYSQVSYGCMHVCMYV